MKALKFETKNREVSKVKSTVSYIAKTASSRQDAVNRLRDILSDDIVLGFGGSHVWAANKSGERIFIIEGY